MVKLVSVILILSCWLTVVKSFETLLVPQEIEGSTLDVPASGSRQISFSVSYVQNGTIFRQALFFERLSLTIGSNNLEEEGYFYIVQRSCNDSNRPRVTCQLIQMTIFGRSFLNGTTLNFAVFVGSGFTLTYMYISGDILLRISESELVINQSATSAPSLNLETLLVPQEIEGSTLDVPASGSRQISFSVTYVQNGTIFRPALLFEGARLTIGSNKLEEKGYVYIVHRSCDDSNRPRVTCELIQMTIFGRPFLNGTTLNFAVYVGFTLNYRSGDILIRTNATTNILYTSTPTTEFTLTTGIDTTKATHITFFTLSSTSITQTTEATPTVTPTAVFALTISPATKTTTTKNSTEFTAASSSEPRKLYSQDTTAIIATTSVLAFTFIILSVMTIGCLVYYYCVMKHKSMQHVNVVHLGNLARKKDDSLIKSVNKDQDTDARLQSNADIVRGKNVSRQNTSAGQEVKEQTTVPGGMQKKSRFTGGSLTSEHESCTAASDACNNQVCNEDNELLNKATSELVVTYEAVYDNIIDTDNS